MSKLPNVPFRNNLLEIVTKLTQNHISKCSSLVWFCLRFLCVWQNVLPRTIFSLNFLLMTRFSLLKLQNLDFFLFGAFFKSLMQIWSKRVEKKFQNLTVLFTKIYIRMHLTLVMLVFLKGFPFTSENRAISRNLNHYRRRKMQIKAFWQLCHHNFTIYCVSVQAWLRISKKLSKELLNRLKLGILRN